VYCVFALSFTFLIKSFFLSSTRFRVKVFNLLTLSIRAWFKNLGSDLNPRFSMSRKSDIFKVVLKECRVAR
jgi:hypothetical protein